MISKKRMDEYKCLISFLHMNKNEIIVSYDLAKKLISGMQKNKKIKYKGNKYIIKNVECVEFEVSGTKLCKIELSKIENMRSEQPLPIKENCDRCKHKHFLNSKFEHDNRIDITTTPCFLCRLNMSDNRAIYFEEK